MKNRVFSLLLTTLLGQSFLFVRLKRRVDQVTTDNYKKLGRCQEYKCTTILCDYIYIPFMC